jgi:hypothetical protein
MKTVCRVGSLSSSCARTSHDRWRVTPALREERCRAVYALAQVAALRLKGAYEIVAIGSMRPSGLPAAQGGLRIRRDTPAYLLNKKRRLTLPRNFQFQMSEDAAFLDLWRASY